MTSHRPIVIAALSLPLLTLLGACGGDDSAATPAADADVVVNARDNVFDASTYSATAGEVTISYVEKGNVAHTLLIDGVDGFKLEVSPGRKTESGTTTLAAGTYKLFCDVPGHEATMHAILTVT